MLSSYGLSTTLTRITGSYDPATGTNAQSESVTPITVALFDYDRKFIDGTHVRQGDKQAFAAPVTGADPQPGDKVAWGGAALSVIAVKPLAPAGETVLYELQLRGN